ncbi:hypothetical protein ABKV19_026379 [Rosa sericea]
MSPAVIKEELVGEVSPTEYSLKNGLQNKEGDEVVVEDVKDEDDDDDDWI